MTRVWNVPVIDYTSLTTIHEMRSVALVTSSLAWNAIKDQLQLRVAWRGEPVEATQTHWDDISRTFDGEVVYAVGGGLVVDVAKYLAAKHRLPLICIPTALSVDAFFTWASGIRRDGCVYYIETKPPDRAVIDFTVLANAPTSIRAAGICDVLSIATGSWDWRYAHEHGKNPPHAPYVPYIDTCTQAILQGSLDCAAAAGRGDASGLRQLVECLVMEVQICNLIGHSRPEEGSEHYFAYAVENVMGKGLPHGDLVGPGILTIANLQGQDTAPLRVALEACGIPLHNIPDAVVAQTLRELPAYAEKHNLAWGIAHTLL